MPSGLILFLLIIYFLPTIIVLSKKGSRPYLIFACNLLVGWTIMGWFYCLMWAITKPRNK